MHFSRSVGIVRTTEDDWFDVILETDTRLFVDPFLIFRDEDPLWSNAYDILIERFNTAFKLVADGYQNKKSLPFQKALALLRFPEPREFCLGFTAIGTAGAGGRDKYAVLIADGMEQAIRRGLIDLKHFEELGILNEGIGPDRISDLTCTFLKSHFVGYTQAVCQRHGIEMAAQRIYASSFDDQRLRWNMAEVALPVNPANQRPLLLVPKRFLRDLPTINAVDWWNWYETEQLRIDLNYQVMGAVDKKTIVRRARGGPSWVQQYAVAREVETPRPYDLGADPNGVYLWDKAALEFVEQHPADIPQAHNPQEFLTAIDKVVDQFQLYVEQNRGWSLLWNENGKEKREEAAQLLFKGIAGGYCKASDIVLDREVELGRGPVDFKFSNGYQRRALMEVKKLHNPRLLHGIEHQLPSYMKSDEVTEGWFVIVRYDDSAASQQRLTDVTNAIDQIAEKRSIHLRIRVIDARRPASASNIQENGNDDDDGGKEKTGEEPQADGSHDRVGGSESI